MTKKNLQTKRRRSSVLVEALEARFMMSADVPGVDILIPDQDTQDLSIEGDALIQSIQNHYEENQTTTDDATKTTGDSHELPQDSESSVQARTEIVFVNDDVTDYQELIDGIESSNESSTIEVVVLDSSQNGIEQVSEILSTYTDLDAIHIISHGSDGAFSLGNEWLENDDLRAHSDDISLWADALSEDADILLYGCDVSVDGDGEELVGTLADLTGADVASSTDKTGSELANGDWDLEYETGLVETNVAITEQTQVNWSGSLSTYLVANTNDSGAGSLRQAIIDANANAGTDNISFNIDASDAGHFYYVDDGVDGALGSIVNTTETDDANIANIDLDFTKSWYSIKLSSMLPYIDEAVILDGTSQAGYMDSPIIQLDGSALSLSTDDGILINSAANDSIIKGLVISNFTGDGIDVRGDSAIIQGNYVGTDVSGTIQEGTSRGIILASTTNAQIGGTGVGEGNLLSGNYQGLVIAGSTGTSVEGNLIGTDATGTTALGNSNFGIYFWYGANSNTIGGTTDGAGNIVAYSGSDGIEVGTDAGIGNTILGNNIFSNSSQGINLDTSGVSANDVGDADTGANNLQNYPVVSSAVSNGVDSIIVKGSFNSIANTTFRLEYFSSTTEDATGYGEGETYLGFVNVTTDGSGNATFDTPISAVVASGSYISATATNLTTNDTSEFAQNIQAVIQNSPPVNSVPTAQTTDEDTSLVFNTTNGNLISISDVDAGTGLMETAISVNDGILTLSGTNGLTFIAGSNASSTMTIQGTLVDINAALDGLSFTPNTNFSGGVSLEITTHDDVQLIGSYTFDNTANLGEDNGAGITYDGTIVGATSVNDTTRGDVLSFDGNDYVQISGLFDEPANITLSAWVNLTASDTTGASIISLGDSAEIFYGDWDGGNVIGAYYDGSAWHTVELPTTNLVGAGWHHIAYSVDDTNHVHTLYFDGTAVASDVMTGSVNYTLGTDSYIGTHGNGETVWDFMGLIDDARIYDRVLTGAEIAQIMNSTAGSDTDTVMINVDAVNDAPTLTALSHNPTFTEGDANAQLFGFVTLDTIETGQSLDEMVFTVTNVTDGNDELVTLDGTTFVLADLVSGTTATNGYGYSVSLAGTTATVTLSTSGATTGDIANLGGSINYMNSSENPTTSDRVFTIASITDDGGTANGGVDTSSPNLVSTVTLVAVNDAPTTSGLLSGTFNEDFGILTMDLRSRFDDFEDSDAALTYTIVGNTNPTLFDTASILPSDIVRLTAAADQNGTSDITIRATDTGGLWVESTFTVTVNSVNDAPILTTGTVSNLTVSEDSGFTSLGLGGVTYGTGGGSDESGQTLTYQVTAVPSSSFGDIYLADGTTKVTVSTLYTLTEIQGMQFTPASNQTGNSAFQFNVIDDGGTANSGVNNISQFMTITIDPVNDAPSLDLDADNSSGSTGVDYQTTYVEGNAPVLIVDSDASLSDVDNTNLNSIIVTLTNEQESGSKESLAANIGTTALTAIWDGGANVLTISGTGTVSDYESVLATVTYENTSHNPNTTDRIITFVANDGTDDSIIATSTVSVVTVSKAPTAGDDAFTVDEGSPNNILDLAANDNDLDGDLDISSISIITGPTNGSLIVNADGTVSYTHDGSETIVDSFTYTINDLIGATSNVATVDITVTPVNDPTVVVNDTASTTEDTAVTVNVLANDTDIDGANATLISASNGTNGITSVNTTTGVVTYTPNANFNGKDSFTYINSEGNTGTVTVTVTPQNDPTVVVNDSATTNEDTAVAIAVLANDTDIDGANATLVSATDGTNGTTSVNTSTGEITYIPNANFNGTDSFTYTNSEGNTGTVTVTVTPQNDPTVVVNDSATTNEDTAVAISVLTNDTDIDGANATLVSATNGTNGTTAVNTTTGVVSYTPNANFNGTDSFTYTNSEGNTGTVNIVINPVNDAPVNSVTAAQTTNEDTSLIFNSANSNLISISDIDASTGLLEVTLSVNDGTLTLSGTAGLTFTSGSNTSSTMSIQGTLSDINAALDGLSYTPTANYNGSDTLTIHTLDSELLSLNIDANLLGYYNFDDTADLGNDSSVVGSNDGTIVGATTVIDAIHGDVLDFNSGDYVEIAGLYGEPADVTLAAWVNLTAVDVNSSHVISLGDSVILVLDKTKNSLTGVSGAYYDGTDWIQLSTGIFIENTGWHHVAYSFDDTNNTQTIYLDGIAINTETVTDSISYTLGANTFIGTNGNGETGYDFAGQLDDARIYDRALTAVEIHTLANDITLQDSDTVDITVDAVNAPTTVVDDTASTTEDTAVTVNVLANDTDIDGANATLISATNGINGTTSVNTSTGEIIYTPNANFNGTDTFTYTNSEGNTGTVTVTVSPVNDPTVVVNDSTTTNEDTAVTVNVLANDTDIDGANATLTSASNGTNGITAINAATGEITYTPNANFNGTDTFTYTNSEGNTGTVTVTVNPVNDPTVVVNDSTTTNEDTAVDISVLSNDTDIDGNEATLVSATNGTNGTTAVNTSTGEITYTPNANFKGTDSFSYTNSEGNTGTVTVTVTPVNDETVVVNDTATTNEDTAVDISVLANDTDIDGANATLVSASNGTNGLTAVNTSTGEITYTPNANFNGTDSFTYTNSEGTTGTVTVTVDPVTDLSGADDNFSTNEDTVLNGDVSVNDTTTSDGTLSYTLGSDVRNGALILNNDGTFSYTPSPNYHGSDSFSYTVTDSNSGESSTQSVTLTITPVNDATAVTGDITGSGDAETNISGILNATDADGLSDGTYFSITTEPMNGTATINPESGEWSYVPLPDHSGNDSFVVTITDDEGNSKTTMITVTVHELEVIQSMSDSSAIPADVRDEGDPDAVQEEVEANVKRTQLQSIPIFINETINQEAEEGMTSDTVNYDVFDSILNSSDPGVVKQHDAKITKDPAELKPIDLDTLTFINQTDDEEEDLKKMYQATDKEYEEEIHKNEMSIEVATGISLSLTAGFVAWLLRSGTLIASLFATMPMWRHFDPIMVFSESEEEDEKVSKEHSDDLENTEQTQKVEQIFEKEQ